MGELLHARMRKSSSSVMLTELISGVQMMARELPPKSANLASMSPKVRVTERRPGKARWGPRMKLCSSPS
jgi:hypothetical protein